MKKNKKKFKISVIVTYHNENFKIIKTLDLLLKQSFKPKEIIFIDSESTDKTSEILEKKLKLVNKKYNIKNYSNLQSPYPSTSKNLGIQLAKYPFVAFMDCGLVFSKDWIKNKIELLEKNNAEAVIGSCKLTGHNNFDKACIANTYGLKKKNVFLKIGYFDSSRSLYDVIWKKKLKKSKVNFITDYKNCIKYDGISYAKNIYSLYKKSILYAQDTLNIKKNIQTKFYIFSSIFASYLFLHNINFFLIAFGTYSIARIIFAKIKSQKHLNLFDFSLIFKIIVTGLVIDLAKVVGSYKSLFSFFGINSLLSLIFLIYIVVFSSPLVSFLSNNLAKYQNEINFNEADAIVVFSGGGNIRYNSESYKSRALEALLYLDKANIKKIYLSSGSSETIADTDLLKIFLISKNVNPELIYIFKKYPNSTYQNVLMVGEELIKKNYKNIIFLTTSVHNKRSISTWKKQFPQIKIAIPQSQLLTKWQFSLNEIVPVFYEYLAIVGNAIQGRM